MGFKRMGVLLTALILLACIANAADDTGSSQTNRYFVVLQDNVDQSFLEDYGNVVHNFKIMNAVAIELTPQALEQLKTNPNVKTIEEDQIFYLPEEEPSTKSAPFPTTSPLTTLNETTAQSAEEEQWNLGEAGINAQAAWDTFGVEGEGVKIAIISSGINTELPEIAGRCLGSHSVIGGDTTDNLGWGTMMASAILAAGPKVKGIAPKAQYYNIKLTNDGYFGWTDFLAAYEWVLLETDAEIIYTNVWITTEFWVEPMLTSSYAAGRLFVSQSNNLKPRCYPARYAAVIGVGGYEDTEPPMLLSLNGNEVEVVGPGKAVPVINKDGDKTTDEGARIAAAQLAGALALMIDYNRTHKEGYNNSALRLDLNQSALNLWPDNPQAGAGKVDVNAALTWMANDWFLEYKVNYLNPVTYDWDNNPVYWSGIPIQYTITVKNNSNKIINSKTITDLNVVSKQLYNGREVSNTEFFNAITLEPGEEKTVGQYTIQPTQTGTLNTQITLKKERVILQDSWLPSFSYTAILENSDTAGTFIVMNKPVPQGTCSDSDGGVDPWVFGTCTDSRGARVSDQSLLENGSNEGGRVTNGAYVSEAFCLTEEMRLHCALENGIEYCYSLPNYCYAASLLPSSGLAWTYFDRNDEAYVCPHPYGSYMGACIPAIAGFKCMDELHYGYQNERYQWSQTEYCNGKCTNNVCTKLSGTCPGTQANEKRCIYFDAAHGGPSEWLQYCRVQYPTAPTGAWTNLKECPLGCLNGECIAGTAALSESDAPIDSNTVIDGNAPIDANTLIDDNASTDENTTDGNVSDQNVLDENSPEPPLQTLSAPETEPAPELPPEPAPEPPANPPAQNTGNSGGGGGYASTTRIISNNESIKETKAAESAVIAGEKDNPESATNVMTGQETKQEEQTETQPNVLPEENLENENPTGFASLAQNVLSVVIVSIGSAIALIGKLFFR